MRNKVSIEVSDVIKFLRFPLAFCVIIMHTHFPMCRDVQRVSNIFLPSPVQTFFFISAFLFFYSFESWQWSTYKEKMHRRLYSLVIPYFIWNTLTIIYYYLVHRFASGFIDPNFQNVEQFGILQYIRAFWDIFDGHPIAYQFWFIRDLILMTLLAPIFYFTLKNRIGWIVVLLLSFNTMFGVIDFTYLGSISWFAIGAFVAIHNIEFLDLLRKSKYAFILLFLFCAFATVFNENFRSLTLFFGVFAIFDLSRILVKHNLRMPALLSESAFFIYAFHGCTIMVIVKVLSRLLPQNEIAITIAYFIAPIIMTAISVAIYKVLRSTFPRITDLLVGKRVTK